MKSCHWVRLFFLCPVGPWEARTSAAHSIYVAAILLGCESSFGCLWSCQALESVLSGDSWGRLPELPLTKSLKQRWWGGLFSLPYFPRVSSNSHMHEPMEITFFSCFKKPRHRKTPHTAGEFKSARWLKTQKSPLN